MIVRILQLLNFRSKLWTWWTAIVWECFLRSLQRFQCWKSGSMSEWSVGYDSCWLYCRSMEWEECPSGLHSAGILWSTQCNLSENVWSMIIIIIIVYAHIMCTSEVHDQHQALLILIQRTCRKLLCGCLPCLGVKVCLHESRHALSMHSITWVLTRE